MKKKYVIYALSCPYTHKIRYVGATKMKISDRFKSHMAEAKVEGKNTPKNHWVLSLINKNNQPIISILEEVNMDNWAEKETWWIKFYNGLGFDLLNLQKTGKQVHTQEFIDKIKSQVHTKESIEKQIKAYKNNLISGRIKAPKNSKSLDRAVLKFSIAGEFICEYCCTSFASAETGVKRTTICENLRGANKTAGGFIFKFKNIKKQMA